MKQRFNINKGTSSQMKVARSAKFVFKSGIFKYHKAQTGAADGLSNEMVMKTIGHMLLGMLASLIGSRPSKK